MAKVVLFLTIILIGLLSIVQSLSPELSPEEAPVNNTSTGRGRPHRQVRCRDPSYERCCRIRFACPPGCPFDCSVDCEICRPVCSCDYPGAVCQDPRFVGGDGNTFYFHGRRDADFCIVSDNDFHINAHFIGKRSPNLTRDFTWVQSIGAIFGSHKLLVAAKRASVWDEKIDHLFLALDDVPVDLPSKEGFRWRSLTAPRVSFARKGPTNGVVLEVKGLFMVHAVVVPITAEDSRVHGYNITDDNCFAHLELGFKFYNMSNAVDGVLGQTYRPGYVSMARAGVAMPVMGGTHKFSSSGLFTTDCAVSRFRKDKPSNSVGNSATGHQDVQCTSMNGSGILCKK